MGLPNTEVPTHLAEYLESHVWTGKCLTHQWMLTWHTLERGRGGIGKPTRDGVRVKTTDVTAASLGPEPPMTCKGTKGPRPYTLFREE